MKQASVIFLIIVLCFSIAIGILSIKLNNKDKEIVKLKEDIEYYKKAANPSGEIIDSLVYNIIYRDTIIYKSKTKYLYDIEIIKTATDSSVVDMFHKLVWAE